MLQVCSAHDLKPWLETVSQTPWNQMLAICVPARWDFCTIRSIVGCQDRPPPSGFVLHKWIDVFKWKTWSCINTIYLPTFLPTYLSTYVILRIYLPIYLRIYLSTYLSIHPSIRLSPIHPSRHLFTIYPPSIHLFIHPSIHLSHCASIQSIPSIPWLPLTTTRIESASCETSHDLSEVEPVLFPLIRFRISCIADFWARHWWPLWHKCPAWSTCGSSRP